MNSAFPAILMPTFTPVQEPLLLSEIRAALAEVSNYEVIFVDDCSDDGTAKRLAPKLNATGTTGSTTGSIVRVVRHASRSGQSAAVRTGVRTARGIWVATLDGDGQNDPADIPNLLNRALSEGGPELVGGLRRKRRDVWSKRVATKIANGLRQKVLNDGCMDTGCGIKVFRQEAHKKAAPWANA